MVGGSCRALAERAVPTPGCHHEPPRPAPEVYSTESMPNCAPAFVAGAVRPLLEAEWRREALPAGKVRSTARTWAPGMLVSIAVIALATAAAKLGAFRSNTARCTPASDVKTAS